MVLYISPADVWSKPYEVYINIFAGSVVAQNCEALKDSQHFAALQIMQPAVHYSNDFQGRYVFILYFSYNFLKFQL